MPVWRLAGAEGNVGGEACAAAGLFHERGRGGWVAKLNPSQADAGWVSGVAEALHRFELCRLQIHGESRGRLSGGARRVQQILEQLDHVRGSGVDTAAGARGQRFRARAFFFYRLHEAGALLFAGHESCIPHVQRLQKGFMQKLSVAFAGSGGEGIAKEIEADVRVKRSGSRVGGEFLLWQPGPASGVVGECKVRHFGGRRQNLARQSRCVQG